MEKRKYGSTEWIKKLVGVALLAAIVVVLQMVSALTAGMLPFSITLALVPIVVGAAMYGAGTGALLGGVFGLVVLINCITGVDKGGHILWEVNPFLTLLTCIGKGVLAGLCAGLLYRLISRKNVYAGVVAAAIVCPVVNTGLFCTAMLLFFKETLIAWAGDTAVAYYMIMSLVGVNFLIEMLTNVVLSPIAARIIKIGKRM